MTDFVRDLEAELLAAARRRSSRRRLRWPAARPIAVLAAVAAAIAAFALVPREPDVERPAPGSGGSFAVAAMDAPEICDPPVRLLGPPPERTEAALPVLTRKPRPGDFLPPAVADAPSTWLPVNDWSGSSRQLEGMSGSIVVLGTNDVRDRPSSCGKTGRSRGPGACLVASAGEPERVRLRCFTLGEIRAGRAFAALDGRLLGLVPVGVTAVDVTRDGTTQRIPVLGNALQREVPGLRAGDEIRVRLLERRPTVIVAGEGEHAEEIAARLRARLDADVTIMVPRNFPGVVTEVQPQRPGSGPLAREIAGILDGARVNPEIPTGKASASGPDVVVWLRMR